MTRTPPPRPHLYQGDGVFDRPGPKGQDRCTECGLPEAREWHELPDVPAQAEHRRRAGDAE